MKSISKGGTVFDGFVEDAKDAAPKLVAKSLERIDVALYSAIDHSRFRCVKAKARTVMTSLGPVTLPKSVVPKGKWCFLRSGKSG